MKNAILNREQYVKAWEPSVLMAVLESMPELKDNRESAHRIAGALVNAEFDFAVGTFQLAQRFNKRIMMEYAV